MVIAKAYADWVTRSPELRGASQFINDPPALYAAGIEPVYVPTRLPLVGTSSLTARTTRVKNSVDVKMTADCIQCAHSYPNIGIYVLVSGDSDFIHVINSLRAIGKRAIVIGVSWSTSRRLADQVDALILYDSDVDPETPQEPTPVEPSRPPARAGNAGGRQQQSQQSQQLSEVIRVIEDIVRAERQAGRTPLLTSLKQRIMRRVPGFDEKKLGFSGFKKLMLRTTEEGNIKLVTVGLVDWVIMAYEPTPQEALPDSRGNSSSIESVVAEEEVIPAVVTEPAESQADEAESDKETDAPEESAEVVASAAAGDASADAVVEGAAHTEDTADAELDAAASADSSEPAEAPPDPLPPLSPELERVLEETLAQLELPDGPGDGLDGRRLTDLIIMADTLEHREGVSHVAFNFLIGEVCDALREGLNAEHAEITHRWGERIFSRTYVTRLVRALSGNGVFVRDWHSDRDEETGRTRRRRTFNLNRSHPLVEQAVKSLWGAEAEADLVTADMPEPELVASPDPEVGVAESDTPTEAATARAGNGFSSADEADSLPMLVEVAEEGPEDEDNGSGGDDGIEDVAVNAADPGPTDSDSADGAEDAGANDAPAEAEPISAVNRVMRLFRG